MTILPKTLLRASFILLISGVYAAEVGDRYEKILREHGDPVGQVVMGNRRVLSYPKLSIRLKDDVVVAVTPVADAPVSVISAAPPKPSGAAPVVKPAAPSTKEDALNAKKTAETRVREIVNQPVNPRPVSRGMRVSTFSEGWFHEGASKPDFERVDVRATQEFPYAQKQYVTSPLNPGVAFPAQELEFNPMLKFFYTDLSTPKKKLSEAEMLEINTLYKTIGKSERELQAMARAATSAK